MSVIAVLAAAGGMAVYLTRTQWSAVFGSEGNFSKDTYLGGGTGKHEYTKHIKIHYQYIIIAGSMRFELTDESGQVVYGMDITESCEGEITFDNEIPQVYYDHEYALSEDTVAYSSLEWYKEYSNFILLFYGIRARLRDFLYL